MSDTQAIAARLTAIAERLKQFVRDSKTGGCWIPSMGHDCTCPLCDVDRLSAHVETLTQQVADSVRASAQNGERWAKAEQENARLTALNESLKSEFVARTGAMLVAEQQRDAALAEADRRTHEVELCYGVQKRLTEQRDAAHAALTQIVDESDSACGCDHTDENCCVLQGGGCAFCTAAVALDAALAASAPPDIAESRDRMVEKHRASLERLGAAPAQETERGR